MEKEHNNEYPDILSTKDIDENSCLEWKVSKNDTFDDDNIEEQEADEDLSDIDNIPDDNYNNPEPDYDEIMDDDVFALPKTTEINTPHSVELNNDLLTNTSNLEFEKYDYASPIIPAM